MNTRKLRKAILTLCSALLLVSLSVGITVAYLTSEDSVTNSFTVGNVQIKLDEAPVDEKGQATAGNRVKENEYHLLPNHTYDKDPTVTVLAKSEESYVRVFVTVTDIADVDAMFDNHEGMDIEDVIIGLDTTKWVHYGEAKDANNARTFELRYYEAVAESETDTVLTPVFTKIHVPGDVTNTELGNIAEMKIEVKAQAIQAAGFADADKAWAEWVDTAAGV